MRGFSFVIALLFAFTATSCASADFQLEARKNDGNGTRGGNSEKRMCRQMNKLESLTQLAANQTRLDAMVAKGKINQTVVDAIKAQAAKASTELQTLQTNATLVQDCAVFNAHRKDVFACKKMKKLNKLAALANNQTAMDAFIAKKKLNGTEVDSFKKRVMDAASKVQTMSSNTTLTSFCSQREQNKGASGSQAVGSSGGGSSASSSPEQQAKNGATGPTIQPLGLVIFFALASIFVVLL